VFIQNLEFRTLEFSINIIMPNKVQTVYSCSACDAQSPKWSGRCLECGGWGTLQMQTVDQKSSEKNPIAAQPAAVLDFNQLEQADLSRLETKIGEIDRVLGGGLVKGSLVLIAGEPGIGKSTLVAQIAQAIGTANPESSIFYVSGEESAGQLKNRLDRLSGNLKNLKFIGETNCDKIISAVREAKPILLVVDSIQTIYASEVAAEAGSISQIRAATVKFLEMAKQMNIAVILIGHITKDGSIAGPKSLEHIVDAVAYLECETAHDYRILRATKNRFGSINEIGIFEMTGTGFKEIANPSSVFIEDSDEPMAGSVISSIIEGTRPFLVEVQALVSKTVFGYPQRKASGFDLNRLQILTAVLAKRAKINLTNQDVILNIVGGLKITEPSLDLAVCLAIASSLLNQSLDRQILVLGEVGLGGEIRNIAKLEVRLREAEKLGFTKAIIPGAGIYPVKSGSAGARSEQFNGVKMKKIKTFPIKNIGDLLKFLNK